MIDLTKLGTVTSEYGSRPAPTAGASTNHKGIDVVLNDSNIPAVTSGTVSDKGSDSSRGNWISIRDAYGNVQTYMHMASGSSLSVGDKVAEGDTVGIMGSTGISTGNHVHFQVHNAQGAYINPETYFGGAIDTAVTNSRAGSESLGLEWWGDIVKVVIMALLIIAGVAMFAMGVLNTNPLKKITGGKK